MSNYTALSTRKPLTGGVRLCRPAHEQPGTTLDSPAISVMTDLTQVAAAVTSPDMTVHEANRYMVSRGVRMLLVLDHRELLVGIVTSNDILGEKPVSLTGERGVHHADILVADVMTPASRLEAFDLQTVQGASVGQVVASLQRARRHHALVTQRAADGMTEIRGIFSLSQIARQLGTPLALSHESASLADMAALMH